MKTRLPRLWIYAACGALLGETIKFSLRGDVTPGAFGHALLWDLPLAFLVPIAWVLLRPDPKALPDAREK